MIGRGEEVGRFWSCFAMAIGQAKSVLLLFNKEDISKMKVMLTEDWLQIPDDGKCDRNLRLLNCV